MRSKIKVLKMNDMGWRFFLKPGGLDLGQLTPAA